MNPKLFTDLFNQDLPEIDEKAWTQSGELMDSFFLYFLQQFQSSHSLEVIMQKLEQRLSEKTLEFSFSLNPEGKPHDHKPIDPLNKEGRIMTLDIAFCRDQFWIDCAMSFPFGKIDSYRAALLESLYNQHEQLLNSLSEGLSFLDWTINNAEIFDQAEDGMGGHGLGRDLHSYPELVTGSREDYVFQTGNPFTVEPVFLKKVRNEKIYYYQESSVLLVPRKKISFPGKEIKEKYKSLI